MALNVTLTVLFGDGDNDLNAFWDNGLCAPITFYSVYLYRNSSLYDFTNQTQSSRTWNNLPSGDYYVTVEAYNPSFCDSGTSATKTIGPFCIPIGEVNISMQQLAEFYNVSGTTNILLSGPNNPSTGNNIFGLSDLPNTGNPSKTTPNAISELRGRCGGVKAWSAPIVTCGTTVTVNGQFSYPRIQPVNMGTSTGTRTLTYEAQAVPDRFIVWFDNQIVIDTKYRGSSLYNTSGTSQRNTFTGSLAGKIDPLTGNTYPFSHADNNADGYPTIVGVGSGTATFNKNTTTSQASIYIYGPIPSTIYTITLSGCS